MFVCVCARTKHLSLLIGGCQVQTQGANSAHPRHELSAAATGRINMPACIFITGLTWRWGERLLLIGGWMTLKILMNHSETPRGPSSSPRSIRRCQFNQNSLIDFLQRWIFLFLLAGLKNKLIKLKLKKASSLLSVKLDMFTLELNRASLQEWWSATCLDDQVKHSGVPRRAHC